MVPKYEERKGEEGGVKREEEEESFQREKYEE